MEQDLDPLDAIKGTRECCYTLQVLKIEQQVDYLHKATKSKPISDTRPQCVTSGMSVFRSNSQGGQRGFNLRGGSNSASFHAHVVGCCSVLRLGCQVFLK